MNNWKAWLQALIATCFGFAAAAFSYFLITRQWNYNTVWAGLAAIGPTLVALLKDNPWAPALAQLQSLNLTLTAGTGESASASTSSGQPAVSTSVPATPQPPVATGGTSAPTAPTVHW